ncbi:MAG TPA: PEP-CTERM sorting domain-containing protein, partial [Tepidisphaeraceae bacterium]|nr:PEP-CTERM sorting domain-containing protein [Tepidisphaeraceae bacterium]
GTADRARALYQLKDAGGVVLDSSDTGMMTNVPFAWTALTWQSNLPVDTRQVSVTYYGADNEYWAGHYGSQIDAMSVMISSVPEPTSLGVLALGTVLMGRRVRRS